MSANALESLILLCIIIIPVPIWFAWRTLVPRESSSSRCPHCKADRSTLESNAPCHACKRVPGIVGLGRLTNRDTVACRQCGHSMEGLAWNAGCPECGLASAAMPHFIRKRSRARGFQSFGIAILAAIWCLAVFLLVAKTIF